MTLFRYFGIKRAEKWGSCWEKMGVKGSVFSRSGKSVVVCRQVFGSTPMREIISEDSGDEWRHGILAKAKGNGTQRIRGLWLVQGKLKPGPSVVVVGT